jgi:hypothetical protein
MLEKKPTLSNCVLAYNLPSKKIEESKDVFHLRKQGIEKTPKNQDYHVTLAWFKKAVLDDIAEELQRAEKALGKKLYQTIFDFDGLGESESDLGRYVYFTIDPESAGEAFFLKQFLAKLPLYSKADNCEELHITIGGSDKTHKTKTKQKDLKDPFSVRGNLMFTGSDGKKLRRFEWHSMKGEFCEIDLAPILKKPLDSDSHGRDKSNQEENTKTKAKTIENLKPETRNLKPISKIAIFPKIQADTAVAVYLLKAFGTQKFPGIDNAPIKFWAAPPQDKTPTEHEADGTLLVDLGGMFDHHIENERLGKRQECVSTLIASHLGIGEHPALKKLFAWAKRDDLEGKGTISRDSLDRAFGLSGIIMNLNREYYDDPQAILDLVLPIIDAHVQEEIRRTILIPQEWEAMLESGDAELFSLKQGSADLKVAVINSDNIALPGFLRAAKQIDVVVQQRSSGHTNIITKQLRNIDLRPTIEAIRLAEANTLGIKLENTKKELQNSGRINEIKNWFYDDAGNTIQNGGVNPEGITPTQLSKKEIVEIVKKSIPLGSVGHLKREREQGR